MDLTPDEGAAAVERHPCPNCEVPPGSACRTRGGKTAAKYYTARFVLVAALREELAVPVPASRRPGTPWVQGPEAASAEPDSTGVPIRIGYARCSTAQQELQTQLDALERAHCTRVFSEKISTRIKVRPELEKALALAHDIKQAAPDQPVILTVHEMKRLARNAAELMVLSAQLQAGGIGLELLAGPLTGVYDPNGMGSMLFAVCAVAAQLDRNYIREKTLEGQQLAASKGNHGGRPKVIDDDMLVFARALRDRGTPIGEIAQKLTIGTGKSAGQQPSVASLYRALAETHGTQAT
ncbi:recombinase family protein [Kribbella qitaiheensis]|uniref:Recombinase family protein n=1 Tax=Kribbella qitaiheensis TaxID=1544730 RepID=A0A7G6WT79_9ACTN|nr:recombinase family protein [Kribbella qitaiheensis]QNE17194.1 recombinase family protein [Kribbella qitaiheensis]